VKFSHCLLVVLVFAVCSSPVLGHEGRATFFDHPRRGANYFNKTPREQWFADAAAADIDWVRMTWSKWPGTEGEFLVGRGDESYARLVPQDLAKLKEVLDWAERRHVKVVLTPLSLPGARWRQNNGGKFDKRMWTDGKYHALAARFWREFAAAVKDHPAVVGYDILNEPAPERAMGLGDEFTADIAGFYDEHRGTPADVNQFNRTVLAAIREVDPKTPVIVESSFFGFPGAVPFLEKLDDPGVVYSFHAYAPWKLVNFKQNGGKYAYPGDVPLDETVTRRWDRAAIAAQFDGVSAWAVKNGVPANRILVGEFGCDRRIKGCARLFADTLAEIDARRWHWAFYAFREDEWDAMDYELGEKKLPGAYWQAVERGEDGERFKSRGSNPIWDVLAGELKKNREGVAR
jgi:aryl-phospho-beta-D-glucosidase BglC (GH1 family)